MRYHGRMVAGRPLLTRAEMQAADRLTIEELGVPSLVLMETAGRAVAEATRRRFGPSAPVLAVAGTGNNGADAMVAARVLAGWGHPVRVVQVGAPDRRSPDASHQAALLEKLGIEVLGIEGEADAARLVDAAAPGAVLVEGLFGLGLDRPIAGWRAAVVEVLRGLGRPTVAVDVPSGVDADTGAAPGPVVPADLTVTFQYEKRGLLLHPGRALAGRLEVADIGIPPSVLGRVRPQVRTVDPRLIDRLHAARSPDSHKGRFGHVLVVAGTPERPGSALLAARAALRSGAGLVTVASTAETIRRVAPVLDELMGEVVGESALDPDAIARAWSTRDVLLLGPSLEGDARLGRLLDAVLAEPRPAVLDAGALRAVALDALRDRPGPTVLTPHPGEMSILMGASVADVQRDRIGSASEAAARSNAVVVLKGASTVVAAPRGTAVVITSGNPGLATAGTGDVLGGIVASLLAQGFSAFEAAEAGAELHARAADAAVDRVGERGLVASDLLFEVGRGSPR